MEQPDVSYSSSMRKYVFGMASACGGPEVDRKAHAAFQAIIEKGKQAKAQDEHDQYEARKIKRETDIKNAARIRHAEAEANRRRSEESKLSIDDHKGKLLDEMTKNMKAVLENQYREEIREKVYEDEDKIVSAYEHDIKDQTKARLVKELESVVKAKLGAEFEPEVKQQLVVELESVVKAELRAEYETEIKQQLVKELGPKVEADLRAKYETDIKQQLTKELQSGVKANLHAKNEEEIKNQLMIELGPTVVHKLKGIHTNDVESQTQAQREALLTPVEESFTATPNDIDRGGGEYPHLSYHQHLIVQNGVQSGRQEARSVQKSETSNTDEVAVDTPRGTKRSLSGEDDEEEDLYARHSKRSRSASFHSEEPQSPQEEVSGLKSSYSHGRQPYQGEQYNGEESQDFLPYKGNVGYEDAQGVNGYKMDRGALGYNSSDEVQGSQGDNLDHGGVYDNSAEDDQEIDGNFMDGEGAGYESAEDAQGMNGNFLDREEAGYVSAEDVQGGNGYKLGGEAMECYSSEEEEEEEDNDEDADDEEYESEEEEQLSTAPQAASHSNTGNEVITFSNTQDTAFVLSDSEDEEDNAGDQDKTLVGYEGAIILKDAKHYNKPAEESLFLDA